MPRPIVPTSFRAGQTAILGVRSLHRTVGPQRLRILAQWRLDPSLQVGRPCVISVPPRPDVRHASRWHAPWPCWPAERRRRSPTSPRIRRPAVRRPTPFRSSRRPTPHRRNRCRGPLRRRWSTHPRPQPSPPPPSRAESRPFERPRARPPQHPRPWSLRRLPRPCITRGITIALRRTRRRLPWHSPGPHREPWRPPRPHRRGSSAPPPPRR